MDFLSPLARCRLFILDLLHKLFQRRHLTRTTSMVAVIVMQELNEFLHYIFGVEWVFGRAEGKRREVSRGMT